MNGNVFTIKDIANLVKLIVEKYGVKEIYLFGFYAGTFGMKYFNQQRI